MSTTPDQSPEPVRDERGVGYWIGWVIGFTARWTLRLVLILLVLLLVSYFLIHIPAVQRYAAQQASKSISTQFDVDVNVGQIELELFSSVRLSDVFIGDRQGDTLLVTKSLSVDVFRPIRSLFRRELYVEAVNLHGAELKLYRDSSATEGNYSFLLPYFRKGPEDGSPQTQGLSIDLREFNLTKSRIDFADAYQGLQANGSVDTLEVLLDLLNMGSKQIDGNSVSILGMEVDVTREAPTAFLVPGAASAGAGNQDQPTLSSGNDDATDKPFLSPLAISLADFDILRSSIKYRDATKASVGGDFDPNELSIEKLEISLSDLSIDSDSLGLTLEGVSFKEKRGFRLYDLSASEISFTKQELRLDGLDLQTARSRFGDFVQVRIPSNSTWKDALKEGRINANIKPSTIAVNELLMFVPSLRENPLFADRKNEKVNISGLITGSVDRLNARNLTLRLPEGSFLSADVSARNISQPEEALYNLEVRDLKTSVSRLRALIPTLKLPQNFDKLGEVEFKGRFDGFIKDFVAYGDLRSELGRATVDTRFVNKTQGGIARYTGEAALFDFDLGAWTGNSDWGKVTARADIRDGQGLKKETLKLDLIGAIDQVDFRGYNYRDIKANGNLSPEGFQGAMDFKDEHVDLAFEGKINLAEGAERFDFEIDIRKLNLEPIQLSKDPWSFAGKVNIKSNTLDLDNLEGNVSVSDFRLVNPKGNTYEIANLTAEQVIAPDGSKRLSLNSPLALVDISGDYRLRTLPNSIQSAFAKTYPDLYARTKMPIPERIDSLDTRISLEAKLTNVDSLLSAFNVPVSNFNGSQLALTLDTELQNLDLSLSSTAPKIAGVTVENLGLNLRGQSGEAILDTKAQRISLGAFVFEKVDGYGEYADGDFRFGIKTDTTSNLLGNIVLGGAVEIADTALTLRLDPTSFIDVSNERWVVEEGNRLIIGKNRLDARDVQITSGERSIKLETVGKRGIDVLMRRLNLDLLNNYLNPDKLKISGEVDAYLSATDIYAQEGISFSASIDTLTVNDVDWGAIQNLITLENKNSPLGVYTTFSRKGQQAVLDATIALQDGVVIEGKERPAQYFDAYLNSDDFDMSFISYFVPGITDLQGKLGADLHVKGTPDNMIPDGGILIDDCALTINYTQTRYFADSQFLSIDERILDASGRQITDMYGNVATLTGGLTHEGLKKWKCDVAIRTKKLLVNDTNKDDNPLYYGRAMAEGEIGFFGPFNQTNLDIDAIALAGTKIVFPVTGTSVEEDLRFIRFVKESDTDKVGEEVARFVRGINLDMDIKITPAAELFIVFDEAAGDILRAQGSGDVQIDVLRTGSYTMFGDFEVDRGEYLFTLLNVVNKPFTLEKGGSITWEGDPFGARLNLTAKYDGLSVPPIELIQDFIGQRPELQSLARTRTPVDLFLTMTGNLQRPDLGFAIDLPDLDGQLRNFVDTKLSLIRQDENELNRQVFGLIVLGQFLPSFNQINAGSVGFNTISELFSNQLSYVLTELFSSLAGTDGALSGIDFDVNLQSNSSLSVNPGTGNDLQTSLRTYFFEDRLEIGLGVSIGNDGSQGILTAGKFEVSYALSDDRRLRLKTFASTNVDIGNTNRNKAGVGLSWRREFNSFGELFGEVKKLNRRREEGPIIFKDASRN
ncbi:MAG: translocation/assembly module TamB domain-containing protein [Saprospiraceae bacterium]